MSSPVETGEHVEESPGKRRVMDSPIFGTPSRKRAGLLTLTSPTKRGESPMKRGIIKLEWEVESGPGTPRTPNGRAGLRSPQKRSIMDLDQSARKRANQTSYSRLMDEDNSDDDQDALDRQDQSLAEAIIRQSRGAQSTEEDHSRAYGSDVESELDLTVKKRGRPKKGEQQKPVVIEPIVRPKRNVRNKKVVISDDDEAGLISSDDSAEEMEFSSDEEYIKPKRQRQAKSATATPKSSPRKPRRTENGSPMSSPFIGESPKRKVGRPSKANEVIAKIKSIFQQDDEEFFTENKRTTNSTKKKVETAPENKPDDFDIYTLGSITNGGYIPIISGVQTETVPEPTHIPTKFEPMPIPKLNEDGTIQDKEFITKYLTTNSSSIQSSAILTDDGAIFLEGTEGYFEQHSVRAKPSGHSLSQLAPTVEYSDYIPYIQMGSLFKHQEKRLLHKMHSRFYHQWCFEMSQGFNLNFYGVGSKRLVMLDFLENYFFQWYHEHWSKTETPQVLVVNGYNPSVKFKQIVGDIVSVFIPQDKRKKDNISFPKHVSETVPFLVKYIDNCRAKNSRRIFPKVVLAIHSIDGTSIRDEKTQSLLSQLCSIPEIWLLSSSDNINVSLLWDLHKLKNFNFVFHDLTTYDNFSTEVSFKDILNMGRSTKFNGNKGAKYVLSSLTKNAKNLYRTLLEKQLAVMRDNYSGSSAARTSIKSSIKFGIEFKQFYTACLEEFITSNEINFRTMLGEFMEHKMCSLVKDDSGTEILFVPFTYGEMEKLMGEEF
ncbi:origin recognition complex subunit 2 [[Candida] anglica]|uniref:Origin recognition complex subunit 2 n=1 Tax=[Candida] anglica TaxID=148631 RepID=A0ABP0EAU1_9ASCO